MQFPKMVQVFEHQDRVIEQYARAGEAHDRFNLCPHIVTVAVVRAHKTGRTFFRQGTLFQPFLDIFKQF